MATPMTEQFKILKKWMDASGFTIPDRCRHIKIDWPFDGAAVVTFEVFPETVPDLPLPIEGAELKVRDVTSFGDTWRKYESRHSTAIEEKH